MFENMNIVLGITGGIAAYKSCGIINYLKKEKANVKVIMTEHAKQFITPLTIETLSKEKVITNMFERPNYMEVEHISLANWADIFLIIPATANIIGKIANGIADDMLSTTIIATRSLVIFAPAMNNKMYENIIVQNNIKRLKEFGYQFIEPAIGYLACGYEAKGKLPKNEVIINKVKQLIKENINKNNG